VAPIRPVILSEAKDLCIPTRRGDSEVFRFAQVDKPNCCRECHNTAPVFEGLYSMDEREFFDERTEKKPANLSCPHCHQPAEYEIQWLVRMKKKNLPPRADDRDRAKFAKAQSYMLRRDDMMMCKNMRCRKRFEITGVQSVAFLQDGLPAGGR
jgi:hypothetical protein